MDNSDQRNQHDDIEDRPNILHNSPHHPIYPPNGHVHPGIDPQLMNGTAASGYTLMVAGQRTGKTSFLRLLLDTSDISPTASKDQLASVAKFVQGCSGHTSHIRTASIDVELDQEPNNAPRRLSLTLVDTPSIDFQDEASAERLVLEMLRHVDSRFAEGIEDEWKAQSGDHHVHLCIYFLDPDHIIPPGVPGPPAPLVPRTRTNSFSQPEPEPVILEPPVTTNPLLCRPTLPAAEINTIRRLSARVNVLPVVARADTLTNDRLAAVKMAIRRDLAEAGIGFGIFDMDNHSQYQHHKDAGEHPVSSMNGGDSMNGYSNHVNGSSSSTNNSPPTSPITPSFLRLPYALISPDIYSHSDGVARVPPPRHELVLQYTPSLHHAPHPKLARGRYIRSYRWGSMDVLDPNHCDFLPLRTAIFHHMETLQKYTREYLFDKFRAEYHRQQQQQHQQLAPHHVSSQHISQGLAQHQHLPPLSHASRPILAIDTAPSHPTINRHPSMSISRDMPPGADMHPASVMRAAPEPVPSNVSAKASTSGTRSSKQRTKKITVACNFCRSRKLKCDGGRPACGQCLKRSNPCDYQPQNKRRGNPRQRKAGEDSDSDGGSGDERSADLEEPSLSPEISSQPLSRRSSNVGRMNNPEGEAFAPSSVAGPSDARLEPPPPSLPPLVRTKPSASASPVDTRNMFRDTELPRIATLALPEASAGAMSAPLPPIRPASEQQAASRKRAATVPGKSPRQASNTGPKVVACNFCRARKTKCDGTHPSCSSCVSRNLSCSYMHPSAANATLGQKKGSRRASTSKGARTVSPQPAAADSSSSHHVALSLDGYGQREGATTDDGDSDLKRRMEDAGAAQPQKKMRTQGPSSMVSGIP